MHDHEMLPWPPIEDRADADRIASAAAFAQSMATRRSCRMFSEREVPRDVIEAALRAAASAPNGANRQPWHFAAVSGIEAKTAIRIAVEEEERGFYGGRAGRPWLNAVAPLNTDPDKPYLDTAPWLIVVFARRREDADSAIEQNYYVTESVGIACGLLLATLHQAGIATLVHTPNPMRFLNRVCGRPEHEKPMMIIVAGHPAEGATFPAFAASRKPFDEIVTWL
jgi:iodotyrosine deiodinase